MLFAEASDDVCDIVIETLDVFCDISGQSINFQKSSMFISPNVPVNRVNTLHCKSKFSIIKDLGKYLVVSLIYFIVNKRTFCYIIEKTQKRLLG